jgi:hypothetical protein
MQVHLLFEIGSSPNLYTRQESNILLAAACSHPAGTKARVVTSELVPKY